MGREVVRVPPDWSHPCDEDGEQIVGAHHEALWDMPEAERSAFQIYENVSEGSPVSPVFATEAEMKAWLVAQGLTQAEADAFAVDGFAPSFVAILPKD
jgi:hypothetical protein